jgi:hypothetical protein
MRKIAGITTSSSTTEEKEAGFVMLSVPRMGAEA